MTRCCICRKKVGLMADSFKCKCSAVVCRTHRFPDQHNCTYDFKSDSKSRLQKSLVHVECDKILKI